MLQVALVLAGVSKSAAKLEFKALSLVIVCLIAILLIWNAGSLSHDQPSVTEPPANSVHSFKQLDEQDPSLEVSNDGLMLKIPDSLTPAKVEFEYDQWGDQLTFLRVEDNAHAGTYNDRFARAGLSLTKLYIAYYVVEYGQGTEEEEKAAWEMITSSSDPAAAQMYEIYPDSIEKVAKEFGLYSTRGDSRWGYSVTSTYDVSVFVAELLRKDPNHLVLEAMKDAKDVAYDEYPQDFGTSELDGALGSKWGWSDKRDMHASVTFGDGWVAAASVYGTRDMLTELSQVQLQPYVEALD